MEHLLETLLPGIAGICGHDFQGSLVCYAITASIAFLQAILEGLRCAAFGCASFNSSFIDCPRPKRSTKMNRNCRPHEGEKRRWALCGGALNESKWRPNSRTPSHLLAWIWLPANFLDSICACPLQMFSSILTGRSTENKIAERCMEHRMCTNHKNNMNNRTYYMSLHVTCTKDHCAHSSACLRQPWLGNWERRRTPVVLGSNLQSLIRRVICIAFAWGSLAPNLAELQKLLHYLIL